MQEKTSLDDILGAISHEAGIMKYEALKEATKSLHAALKICDTDETLTLYRSKCISILKMAIQTGQDSLCYHAIGGLQQLFLHQTDEQNKNNNIVYEEIFEIIKYSSNIPLTQASNIMKLVITIWGQVESIVPPVYIKSLIQLCVKSYLNCVDNFNETLKVASRGTIEYIVRRICRRIEEIAQNSDYKLILFSVNSVNLSANATENLDAATSSKFNDNSGNYIQGLIELIKEFTSLLSKNFKYLDDDHFFVDQRLLSEISLYIYVLNVIIENLPNVLYHNRRIAHTIINDILPLVETLITRYKGLLFDSCDINVCETSFKAPKNSYFKIYVTDEDCGSNLIFHLLFKLYYNLILVSGFNYSAQVLITRIALTLLRSYNRMEDLIIILSCMKTAIRTHLIFIYLFVAQDRISIESELETDGDDYSVICKHLDIKYMEKFLSELAILLDSVSGSKALNSAQQMSILTQIFYCLSSILFNSEQCFSQLESQTLQIIYNDNYYCPNHFCLNTFLYNNFENADNYEHNQNLHIYSNVKRISLVIDESEKRDIFKILHKKCKSSTNFKKDTRKMKKFTSLKNLTFLSEKAQTEPNKINEEKKVNKKPTKRVQEPKKIVRVVKKPAVTKPVKSTPNSHSQQKEIINECSAAILTVKNIVAHVELLIKENMDVTFEEYERKIIQFCRTFVNSNLSKFTFQMLDEMVFVYLHVLKLIYHYNIQNNFLLETRDGNSDKVSNLFNFINSIECSSFINSINTEVKNDPKIIMISKECVEKTVLSKFYANFAKDVLDCISSKDEVYKSRSSDSVESFDNSKFISIINLMKSAILFTISNTSLSSYKLLEKLLLLNTKDNSVFFSAYSEFLCLMIRQCRTVQHWPVHDLSLKILVENVLAPPMYCNNYIHDFVDKNFILMSFQEVINSFESLILTCTLKSKAWNHIFKLISLVLYLESNMIHYKNSHYSAEKNFNPTNNFDKLMEPVNKLISSINSIFDHVVKVLPIYDYLHFFTELAIAINEQLVTITKIYNSHQGNEEKISDFTLYPYSFLLIYFKDAFKNYGSKNAFKSKYSDSCLIQAALMCIIQNCHLPKTLMLSSNKLVKKLGLYHFESLVISGVRCNSPLRLYNGSFINLVTHTTEALDNNNSKIIVDIIGVFENMINFQFCSCREIVYNSFIVSLVRFCIDIIWVCGIKKYAKRVMQFFSLTIEYLYDIAVEINEKRGRDNVYYDCLHAFLPKIITLLLTLECKLENDEKGVISLKIFDSIILFMKFFNGYGFEKSKSLLYEASDIDYMKKINFSAYFLYSDIYKGNQRCEELFLKDDIKEIIQHYGVSAISSADFKLTGLEEFYCGYIRIIIKLILCINYKLASAMKREGQNDLVKLVGILRKAFNYCISGSCKSIEDSNSGRLNYLIMINYFIPFFRSQYEIVSENPIDITVILHDLLDIMIDGYKEIARQFYQKKNDTNAKLFSHLTQVFANEVILELFEMNKNCNDAYYLFFMVLNLISNKKFDMSAIFGPENLITSNMFDPVKFITTAADVINIFIKQVGYFIECFEQGSLNTASDLEAPLKLLSMGENSDYTKKVVEYIKEKGVIEEIFDQEPDYENSEGLAFFKFLFHNKYETNSLKILAGFYIMKKIFDNFIVYYIDSIGNFSGALKNVAKVHVDSVKKLYFNTNAKILCLLDEMIIMVRNFETRPGMRYLLTNIYTLNSPLQLGNIRNMVYTYKWFLLTRTLIDLYTQSRITSTYDKNIDRNSYRSKISAASNEIISLLDAMSDIFTRMRQLSNNKSSFGMNVKEILISKNYEKQVDLKNAEELVKQHGNSFVGTIDYYESDSENIIRQQINCLEKIVEFMSKSLDKQQCRIVLTPLTIKSLYNSVNQSHDIKLRNELNVLLKKIGVTSW